MNTRIRRVPGAMAGLVMAMAAGGLCAGDLGRAVVETLSGERIEGIVSVEKAGLRVSDDAGGTREITPENLRVARLVKGGNPTPPSQPTPRGLRGTYFKTKELSGEAQVRVDARIDFSWGWEAPLPGIEPERFSARWEGFLETRAAGNHTFHLLSNDGARLWVDGRLVVDEWHDQSDTEHAGTIALEAGRRYPLRMEMYEQGGTAAARLFWTPPGGAREIVPEDRFTQPDANGANGVPPDPRSRPGAAGQGLRGRYFATRNLEGFSVERLDPEVNFNWGQGSPGVGAGIGNDNFSVRWDGWLEGPVTGRVTFTTRADDGVRLWVDERQIIDQWRDTSVAEFSGALDLEKGRKYPIRLEYYESAAEATVALSWQADGSGKEVIPARFLNPGRAGDAFAPVVAKLFLRGGSELLGRLHSADKRTVRLETAAGEIDVPMRGIALLQLGDLSDSRKLELLDGKPGCLLRDGEYFEAEFLGLEDGRLRFSSILFGLKAIEVGPVLAVVGGKRQLRDSKFTVMTVDGGKILANEITPEGETLRLLDNSFSRFALPLAGVDEIRGGAYGK